MAGYSGTPLVKKLGIKAGFNIALINEPRLFLPHWNFRRESQSIQDQGSLWIL